MYYLFLLTTAADVCVIDWSMCVAGFLKYKRNLFFSPWNLCGTLVLNNFLKLLLCLSSCGMGGL